MNINDKFNETKNYYKLKANNEFKEKLEELKLYEIDGFLCVVCPLEFQLPVKIEDLEQKKQEVEEFFGVKCYWIKDGLFAREKFMDDFKVLKTDVYLGFLAKDFFLESLEKEIAAEYYDGKVNINLEYSKSRKWVKLYDLYSSIENNIIGELEKEVDVLRRVRRAIEESDKITKKRIKQLMDEINEVVKIDYYEDCLYNKKDKKVIIPISEKFLKWDDELAINLRSEKLIERMKALSNEEKMNNLKNNIYEIKPLEEYFSPTKSIYINNQYNRKTFEQLCVINDDEIIKKWNRLGSEINRISRSISNSNNYDEVSFEGYGQLEDIINRYVELKSEILNSKEGERAIKSIKEMYPELKDMDLSDFIVITKYPNDYIVLNKEKVIRHLFKV